MVSIGQVLLEDVGEMLSFLPYSWTAAELLPCKEEEMVEKLELCGASLLWVRDHGSALAKQTHLSKSFLSSLEASCQATLYTGNGHVGAQSQSNALSSCVPRCAGSQAALCCTSSNSSSLDGVSRICETWFSLLISGLTWLLISCLSVLAWQCLQSFLIHQSWLNECNPSWWQWWILCDAFLLFRF